MGLGTHNRESVVRGDAFEHNGQPETVNGDAVNAVRRAA